MAVMFHVAVKICQPADWLNTINHYKDLLGVVIAAVGIPFLVAQLTQTKRQNRREFERRRIAATSSLPITLAVVSEYASSMLQALSPIHLWAVQGRQDSMPGFQIPLVPNEGIAALERMIELSPNEAIVRKLAAIISDIQVLSSRTHDLAPTDRSAVKDQASMVDENMILAALIHARAADLFDYARTYYDQKEPPIGEIKNALKSNNIRDHTHARLFRRIEAQQAEPIEAPYLGGIKYIWDLIGYWIGIGHKKLWPNVSLI